MMEKFVNEYLPRVNFVLLLVLTVMVSYMVFEYFMEKRERMKKMSAIVREVEDSKIIVVIKDGVFHVLDGKRVTIESLSPLVVRYQDRVFKKEGRFYLYTDGNTIYIFNINNEKLIVERKGGRR